jgi:lipopolysaccharide export system permease protein
MKKILYRKLLKDYMVFFSTALISSSIVVWVFQAVNYLDIMIEDGRDFFIYIKFSLLNFPKILSKLMPFILFFSLFYVTIKNEFKNELFILWNFGVNKIDIIKFYLKFSLILLIFQIFLTAYMVPKTQDLARSYLRTSEVNFYGSFIKTQTFNDTIKGTTIYSEKKDEDGILYNIFIKKEIDNENFQTIYAKRGLFEEDKNRSPVLVLFDGENTIIKNNEITNIGFSKFDLNLSNTKTNTITYIKTQELTTLNLLRCLKLINKINLFFIKITKKRIENCSKENNHNIIKEAYKRLLIPLYIPVLTLISFLLIISSKENSNYLKFRVFVFLFGLIIIIFSEITTKFISNIFINNIKIFILPIMFLIILYLIFFYCFNFKFKTK